MNRAQEDTVLELDDRSFEWSPWFPIEQVLAEPVLPLAPGVYRLRRCGRSDLDYIGQTGGTLRGRVRMLRGIFGDEMPYRDPHTAGPALWSLHHRGDCAFEVSVVEVDAEPAWRKGLEALAISFYRQRHGCSPTANFGRMPTGYVMSSGRNARLAAARRQFRGGPSPEVTASHGESIAPVGPLGGDLHGAGWCGHGWSEWRSLAALSSVSAHARGLYRLRGSGHEGLVYVGEGVQARRLRVHRRTALGGAGPRGAIFLAATPLEFSVVTNEQWLAHQRQELENDLIAAHMLALGRPPAAQFSS